MNDRPDGWAVSRTGARLPGASVPAERIRRPVVESYRDVVRSPWGLLGVLLGASLLLGSLLAPRATGLSGLAGALVACNLLGGLVVGLVEWMRFRSDAAHLGADRRVVGGLLAGLTWGGLCLWALALLGWARLARPDAYDAVVERRSVRSDVRVPDVECCVCDRSVPLGVRTVVANRTFLLGYAVGETGRIENTYCRRCRDDPLAGTLEAATATSGVADLTEDETSDA